MSHDGVTASGLRQAMAEWVLPEPEPPGLPKGPASLPGLIRRVKSRLQREDTAQATAVFQMGLLDWLFRLIRANVKRGRLFLLPQVLEHRTADCLGYAKLLQAVGTAFALQVGTVEILEDNAGRYVPHVANLVTLSGGRRLISDLWYGGPDMQHRRLAVNIRTQGRWQVRDVSWEEFASLNQARGLPRARIEGITTYILGNRCLQEALRSRAPHEFLSAIDHYTKALAKYPANARFHYNRAIAYENCGRHAEAEADYAMALADESSLVRVLAREYEESEALIALDEAGIDEASQQVFLLRKGFVTGSEMDSLGVARRTGMNREQVESILASIGKRLRPSPGFE